MSLPPARSRAGFVSACQQVLALGVVGDCAAYRMAFPAEDEVSLTERQNATRFGGTKLSVREAVECFPTEADFILENWRR